MSDLLTIRTLGNFSVSLGDMIISNTAPRSQKVWKIFKRLITNRHKMVSIETLIETLWPEEEPFDPQKSLYTHMSRLRKLLIADGVDRHCILFQHNSYQWNPQLPIDLDVAEFENLIRQAEGQEDISEKVRSLQKAINIYTGDYLAESSSEIWVVPVANYYRRLYLRAVGELVEVHTRMGMQDEVIKLCSQAIVIEPFEEDLHEKMIQALFINGEITAAQQHYERFHELIQREFGAEPSEEFRTAVRGLWEHDIRSSDLEAIMRNLDRDKVQGGAYFCTSDTFNQIYLFDKRAEERMKFPVFLALITTVPDAGDLPLSDKEEARLIKHTMITLRQCLMRTLRRGDIVSQYSPNQFLLMLSAYLPKDAETALTRVQRMFEGDQRPDHACKLQFNISQLGDKDFPIRR